MNMRIGHAGHQVFTGSIDDLYLSGHLYFFCCTNRGNAVLVYNHGLIGIYLFGNYIHNVYVRNINGCGRLLVWFEAGIGLSV
jgi:hypothetical protein